FRSVVRITSFVADIWYQYRAVSGAFSQIWRQQNKRKNISRILIRTSNGWAHDYRAGIRKRRIEHADFLQQHRRRLCDSRTETLARANGPGRLLASSRQKRVGRR